MKLLGLFIIYFPLRQNSEFSNSDVDNWRCYNQFSYYDTLSMSAVYTGVKKFKIEMGLTHNHALWKYCGINNLTSLRNIKLNMWFNAVRNHRITGLIHINNLIWHKIKCLYFIVLFIICFVSMQMTLDHLVLLIFLYEP